MLQCNGDPSEGWRKPDGFWGNFVLRSGLSNTNNRRRAIYDMWRKNWDGVQERFCHIRNGHKEREVQLDNTNVHINICSSFHIVIIIIHNYLNFSIRTTGF